jgi:hypothetical protein
VCIYCSARGVVIFCVVNMTLTCEWMNEIDMLCFYVETEETGTCTRPISFTRERNSASFHSFRYAPLVKRRNFSHLWKKSQIFNRGSCKNLLVKMFLILGSNKTKGTKQNSQSHYLSFCHCIDCPSVYGLSLPRWYLHGFCQTEHWKSTCIRLLYNNCRFLGDVWN